MQEAMSWTLRLAIGQSWVDLPPDCTLVFLHCLPDLVLIDVETRHGVAFAYALRKAWAFQTLRLSLFGIPREVVLRRSLLTTCSGVW